MRGILRDAGQTLTDHKNAKNASRFLKKIPVRQQKTGEKRWI
jgi:hypothetical protein